MKTGNSKASGAASRDVTAVRLQGLQFDEVKKGVCAVDFAFYTIGLLSAAAFVVYCLQMSAHSLKVTPYYMLEDPLTLMEMVLFSFLTPCCFLASHGGAVKSPSLLAVGVALAGIMLTLLSALNVAALAWFFSGGRFQDKWCDSEAASQWHKATWCSELFYLVLISITQSLSTVFLCKVIAHWAEVNDCFYSNGQQAAKKLKTPKTI